MYSAQIVQKSSKIRQSFALFAATLIHLVLAVALTMMQRRRDAFHAGSISLRQTKWGLLLTLAADAGSQ
jgi:hypothetical protein